MTRPIIIADFGHGPINEACAQLGKTPDFEQLNRLELAVFTAALIARNGPLPRGLSFVHHPNRHDFGTYWTLTLVNDPAAHDSELAFIIGERMQLPKSWIENGFRAPVEYPTDEPPIARTLEDCVRSALAITRPDDHGHFWPVENAILHRNLAAAYPQFAGGWA
jgi:hypothetical protein